MYVLRAVHVHLGNGKNKSNNGDSKKKKRVGLQSFQINDTQFHPIWQLSH
jgi:hypothetical protein